MLHLCARPPDHSLSSPSPLSRRLPSSLPARISASFDSPFTLPCRSWQNTNQRLLPRRLCRPLCPPSTKCVFRPLACERRAYGRFPRPPAPRIIRRSFITLPIHATHSFDRLATPFSRQIVVYAVVIFAVWNIPAVRNVINPLKLFTIGWHELCHIIAVSGLHPSVHCQDPPVRSSTRLRLL